MAEREDGARRYGLEDRTLQFAKDVRAFVKRLPRNIANDGMNIFGAILRKSNDR